MAKHRKTITKARKAPATRGTAVVWPAGIRERYGISAWSVWNWEKKGWLPKRDLFIGGRSGWLAATIEAFEQKGASK